jgi:hypothetical protein
MNPVKKNRLSPFKRVKMVVDYCQSDPMGLSGKTIVWENISITRKSSTLFEVTMPWGIVYHANQHGSVIAQLNEETGKEESVISEMMLDILQVIRDSEFPETAVEILNNRYPARHPAGTRRWKTKAKNMIARGWLVDRFVCYNPNYPKLGFNAFTITDLGRQVCENAERFGLEIDREFGRLPAQNG